MPTPIATAAMQTVPLPASLVTMAEEVARLRGLPAPQGVMFAFVPRASVPGLLEELLSDEDRAHFDQTTNLYRLLGHFRADEDYLSVYRELGSASAAGFYSPRTKTLWAVQESSDPPKLDELTRETRSTLAHELVHATQDATFGLQRLGESGDLDGSLAATCLVEGDAVVHQGVYEAKYLGAPQRATGGVQLAVYTTDIPPSLNREFFFPYTTCADWVRSIRESGGTAAIDALFREPPTATAAVLHPERGLPLRPQAVSLPDLASGLGNGWRRESGGQFGEFQLRNYLQLRLPGLRAATASAGWDGDHYEVYGRDGDHVAVFRMVFSDDGKAEDFRAAQDELLRAMGAVTSSSAGLAVAERPDGTTTARAAGAGREVLFAIANRPALARQAMTLLAGG
ncbi:MAG: hypothetical protein ABIP13_03855 [Tepidiformaceae bacterium]